MRIPLIIVQCLNWNRLAAHTVLNCRITYNRTMLELKSAFAAAAAVLAAAYNRTMLELKFLLSSWIYTRLLLIIVQCLNWNLTRLPTASSERSLIIVQCLNWNSLIYLAKYSFALLIIVQCLNWNFLPPVIKSSQSSYNRTMLELKLAVAYHCRPAYSL